MIARSATIAAVSLLTVTLLGLALPQAAQARDRDYGRESHSYGYHYDDRGSRHVAPRHHSRGHGKRYYSAPSYYYYPAPRVYYSAPYYPAPYYYAPVQPSYPREYGTVGIHLDYNLLF